MGGASARARVWLRCRWMLIQTVRRVVEQYKALGAMGRGAREWARARWKADYRRAGWVWVRVRWVCGVCAVCVRRRYCPACVGGMRLAGTPMPDPYLGLLRWSTWLTSSTWSIESRNGSSSYS